MVLLLCLDCRLSVIQVEEPGIEPGSSRSPWGLYQLSNPIPPPSGAGGFDPPPLCGSYMNWSRSFVSPVGISTVSNTDPASGLPSRRSPSPTFWTAFRPSATPRLPLTS